MRHPAYGRLARAARGWDTGPRVPAGDPTGRPSTPDDTAPLFRVGRAPGPQGEPVCERCRAWVTCCFCDADPDAMRTALRRIAELHSACDPRHCPERRRLAAAR